MKIQLVAPWHSMTERPDVEKYVTFLGWKGADRLPYMHTAFFDYKQQMVHFFRNWTALDDFAYFAWAYKDDLAASEIRRMLVKEASQDGPSVRYVGSGGGGYGGSSHGSSFSSVGGVDPGWGVGADLSKMWPWGGGSGRMKKEQD